MTSADKRTLSTCGAAMLLIAAATVAGAAGQQAPAAGALAMERPETRGSGTLDVTSPDFTMNGALPEKFSDYGQKFSPAIRWSGAPASARTYVVLMEDPDAQDPKPFVHWVLYNLPADTVDLHQAVPAIPRLPELGGALQGRNSRGSIGYFGPRPPKNDAPHHYHFQVFALNAALALPPMATREAVLKAMQGKVVARGSLTGTFAAPASAK